MTNMVFNLLILDLYIDMSYSYFEELSHFLYRLTDILMFIDMRTQSI